MDSSWTKLITTIGLPGALLVYLVYSMINGMQSDAKELKANVRQVGDALSVHVHDTQAVRDNTESMKRILQQICANGATSNHERSLCFQ